MDLSNLHFLRPNWFYALIPLALLMIGIAYRLRHANNWQQVCDPHLLPHLLINMRARRLLWPLLLLGLIWILAVIALAGPSWQQITIPSYRSQAARVIVFDLSPSMYAQDIAPSRLTRAKFKLLDLLKRTHEGQTGLIAFSGEPYVVSPLTQDNNTIAAMIPELDPQIMPVSGNNMAWALSFAAKLLTQAGVRKGDIIVITYNRADPAAIKLAKKLKARGDKISVLGVGTREGAPIPLSSGNFLRDKKGNIVVSKLAQASLQKLANAGGGIYAQFTNDNSDLKRILAGSLFTQQLAKAKQTQHDIKIWQDSGRYFILPILLLMLLLFRRGWLEEI